MLSKYDCGLEDQFGNPTDPAEKAEIDRLRAELAEARRALLASNDTVLANKKLLEANAAKDARIAELEATPRESFFWPIERVRFELCTATNRAERAEERVAELEAAGNRLGDAAVEGVLTSIEAVTQLAEAKARIAELERGGWNVRREEINAALARAERVEAELKEWMEAFNEIDKQRDHLFIDLQRAEAERDAIELFSGAQAAVIKEMREALTLSIQWFDTWEFEDKFWINNDPEWVIKARAALAPSPAGREG